VRLKVNLVSGTRYYRAGEDIPDGAVPVHAAKWAAEDDGDPLPKPTIASPLMRPRAEKRAGKPSKGQGRHIVSPKPSSVKR
jgi:hypothetical protein